MVLKLMRWYGEIDNIIVLQELKSLRLKKRNLNSVMFPVSINSLKSFISRL